MNVMNTQHGRAIRLNLIMASHSLSDRLPNLIHAFALDENTFLQCVSGKAAFRIVFNKK